VSDEHERPSAAKPPKHISATHHSSAKSSHESAAKAAHAHETGKPEKSKDHSMAKHKNAERKKDKRGKRRRAEEKLSNTNEKFAHGTAFPMGPVVDLGDPIPPDTDAPLYRRALPSDYVTTQTYQGMSSLDMPATNTKKQRRPWWASRYVVAYQAPYNVPNHGMETLNTLPAHTSNIYAPTMEMLSQTRLEDQTSETYDPMFNGPPLKTSGRQWWKEPGLLGFSAMYGMKPNRNSEFASKLANIRNMVIGVPAWLFRGVSIKPSVPLLGPLPPDRRDPLDLMPDPIGNVLTHDHFLTAEQSDV
jgi:hypothetical protein